MARTARRQLDGRHASVIWSLFADMNSPLSPKLPDKDDYRY